MSDVVVDDHLLLRTWSTTNPPSCASLAPRSSPPGCGTRLARALSHRAVAGTLSRSLGSADPTVVASAIGAVTTLPDTVGLLSLRELAAAERVGAELCLAVEDGNPPLLAAAGDRGMPTRLIG